MRLLGPVTNRPYVFHGDFSNSGRYLCNPLAHVILYDGTRAKPSGKALLGDSLYEPSRYGFSQPDRHRVA